jgi:hypothetical protein
VGALAFYRRRRLRRAMADPEYPFPGTRPENAGWKGRASRLFTFGRSKRTSATADNDGDSQSSTDIGSIGRRAEKSLPLGRNATLNRPDVPQFPTPAYPQSGAVRPFCLLSMPLEINSTLIDELGYLVQPLPPRYSEVPRQVAFAPPPSTNNV